MAVNLSPIWGAGAQLLDNSGNVLSGGKIYTYAAGTTTQVATYTSNSGVTANSNPIVLNSAGRVPYEIWLTDGQNYKFVLKDSNDVLIGTWDNLSGINSNFIAYTNQQEIQTATAGQTVFNLTTMNYLPGTNSLSVFVDGVNQYGPGAQYAYTETDSNTVTFASGLHVGAEVKFTSSQIQNAGVADASQITYTYPAVGAVQESVEDRLAQSVNVKDFGAVGDGVTDDTAAIQAAINYCVANGLNLTVSGMCLLTSSVNINRAVDGINVRDYFIITSSSGGGFVVNDDIEMFSSSLSFSTTPVSQQIYFDNITFVGNAGASYVLDSEKFLRMRFNGCSFNAIRCGNSAIYSQSFYFTNNTIWAGVGTFWKTAGISYDIKIIGNSVEQYRGDVFDFGTTNGVAVIGNLIQGLYLDGTAIKANNGGGALTIHGNYFEANKCDIDLSGSQALLGISIMGNTMWDAYQDTNPGLYPRIKWSSSIAGCVSTSNYGNGYIHQLVSAGQDLLVQDVSINGPITNYAPLSVFESEFLINTGTGGSDYGGVIKGYYSPGAGGELSIGVRPSYGNYVHGMTVDYGGICVVNDYQRYNNFSRLQVNGSSIGGGPLGIRNTNAASGKYWQLGPDNSANNMIVTNQAGTGVYITDGATSWSSTSDERSKDIIETITNAADKVSSLRAVIGKYKTDAEGTRRSFLIAQDVQAVLPEAVSKQSDEAGTLGVSYTDTIPLLVAAIKELTERIELLEKK